MVQYIIRIELEGNPSRRTYDELHQRLQNVAIFRYLDGASSVRYSLPEATYSFPSPVDAPATAVYKTLKPIIALSGHRYKLLVVKSADWAINSVEWET